MEAAATTSAVPVIATFLPILGALGVVPLSRLSERWRDVWLAIVCVTTVAAIASMVPGVLDGGTYETRLIQMTSGIWLHLRVEPLGLMFAMAISVLWLLAIVYSSGYMADGHRKNRYFSFIMLALAWTLGVAFAANLMTFLVFYELFSILTYPLVVHEGTPEAMAAGTKYIIYILVGGGLVMLAILLTYYGAGGQTLAEPGILSMEQGRGWLTAVFVCYVAGFGVKGALFPLHGWVPDAHPAAPAPFSALLSGVMVAAGSFGIIRVIFNVFGVALLEELGVTTYLGYVAAFTVVFAAVLAVSQNNLKRRLAYSTISQMAYVVLGVALLGEEAAVGSFVHIVNHAFMKGTLFLCAGIFIKKAGAVTVTQLAGIGKKMPLTTAAFTVATLGMIGTPPLSGFVSKWYLGLGMIEVRQPLYLIVLIGGALLAAGYLLPIVYVAYFKKPAGTYEVPPEHAGGERSSPAMLFPALAGATITILLGVFAWAPGLPLSLATMAAERLFW